MKTINPLRDERVSVIQKMLDIANLGDSELAAHVLDEGDMKLIALGGKKMSTVPNELPDLRNRTRRWLNTLLRQGVGWKSSRQKLAQDIGRRLRSLRLVGTAELVDGELSVAVSAQGRAQMVVLAAAYLIDERLELGKALRQCELKKCGKYFMDVLDRGRQRRQYCCDRHSSSNRQARYRGRRG